jgi:hypothetical protein
MNTNYDNFMDISIFEDNIESSPPENDLDLNKANYIHKLTL